MSNRNVFATRAGIPEINDCYFYHEMDLPGVGHVGGEWDLRGREEEYLGGVDLRGKRVLEVGTASGHLCFYMEREGADVVAFDLSENESWDIVPYQRYDWEGALLGRRLHVKRVNNAFWLAHGAFRSKAKMVYGSVYAIPREIGSVDITTFGSILVHVRDPFFALQNALSLTRETVVVTEAYSLPRKALDTVRGSHISFMPDFLRCEPKEAWWHLSPRVIQRFLGVLGFEKCETTYHYQKGRVRKGRVEDKSHRHRFFTIVGHRTQGLQRFKST